MENNDKRFVKALIDRMEELSKDPINVKWAENQVRLMNKRIERNLAKDEKYYG